MLCNIDWYISTHSCLIYSKNHCLIPAVYNLKMFLYCFTSKYYFLKVLEHF